MTDRSAPPRNDVRCLLLGSRGDRNRLTQSFRNLLERLARYGVWMCKHDRAAGITTLTHGRVKRNFAEERDAELLGERRSAAPPKDIGGRGAPRPVGGRHIFYPPRPGPVFLLPPLCRPPRPLFPPPPRRRHPQHENL